MNVKNKIILITGANRGIGKALVEAALNSGATKVYAAARKIDTIENSDPRVLKLKLDVNDQASISAARDQARDIDVLINNAGVLEFGSLLTGDLDAVRRDFETNFYGTLRVIRTFAPDLSEKGKTAIVNIHSIVSLASMAGIGGYSASKAALFSATQAIRAELKSKGVAVYGVFPGPIDTDMARGMDMPKPSPKETAENILQGIESDQEDIFPDGMSKQLGQNWLKDPKSLEQQFSSM